MVAVTLATLGFISGAVRADETIGKWRVSLQFGGISPQDKILSSAGGLETLLLDTGKLATIRDPRPSSSSTISSRLATDPRGEFRASYTLKAMKKSELVLDLGLSYYTGSISNLEFDYALDIEDPNFIFEDSGAVPSCETLQAQGLTGSCLSFAADLGGPTFFYSAGEFFAGGTEKWHYQPVNAGRLRMIPITAGLSLRLRPTKRLVPSLGLSLGYLNASFDSSKQWQVLQNELGGSLVDYTKRGVVQIGQAGERVLKGKAHRLRGPEVDAPSTLFLEARGSVEYQIKPRVALVIETGFSWAQQSISITMDGRTQFGRPTPSISVKESDPKAVPIGGLPAYIILGGLKKTLKDNTGTTVAEGQWPGEYYFTGGTLDYGGFIFSLGVKFTL